LCRLFAEPNPPWVLKGGYASELKFAKARTTKKIDPGLGQMPGAGGDWKERAVQRVALDGGSFGISTQGPSMILSSFISIRAVLLRSADSPRSMMTLRGVLNSGLCQPQFLQRQGRNAAFMQMANHPMSQMPPLRIVATRWNRCLTRRLTKTLSRLHAVQCATIPSGVALSFSSLSILPPSPASAITSRGFEHSKK
jgi:hypothetical protein